jgi:UDP-MurNAc hydroxylase
VREDYISSVLKNLKFDYQDDQKVDEKTILELIPKSFERFVFKKEQIGFNTNTLLFISISKKSDLVLNLSEKPSYNIVSNKFYKDCKSFVKIKLDNRLLFKLLNGPKFSHWNNAEIGSHLQFERHPNIFERGLYHSLCFLHI